MDNNAERNHLTRSIDTAAPFDAIVYSLGLFEEISRNGDTCELGGQENGETEDNSLH